jgi:carboxyl-terminal processing protease
MRQFSKPLGWIAAGAVAGALATMGAQAVARGPLSPIPYEHIRQIAEVFGYAKAAYVEPIDEKKVLEGAIKGMVESLDPHSTYLVGNTLKEFREGVSGKFIGLGIQIEQQDGLVRIIAPIEGSPAERAGLKTDDMITRIDDTQVKGLTLDQAIKRMRGEPDTKVTLTVFRRAENRSFPVTITRAEITQKSVRSKAIEPGYGWVRVSQFQEATAAETANAIRELIKADPTMKGLVLDLRSNPGGLLDSAAGMLSIFLPEGSTAVTTDGQLPQSKTTVRVEAASIRDPANPNRRMSNPLAGLPPQLRGIQVVVLVDGGSASASEIVAGALQDAKRGVVMGAQTFGKGSVQTMHQLTNDAALKLTTSRYFTPSGRSIQAKGIMPDVLVDDMENGNPYAILRMREADYDKHLAQRTGTEDKDDSLEKAREQARKRWDEEMRKPANERMRPPEFGSDKDFALRQALNQLKGQPVVVSKVLRERKDEPKTE